MSSATRPVMDKYQGGGSGSAHGNSHRAGTVCYSLIFSTGKSKETWGRGDEGAIVI